MKIKIEFIEEIKKRKYFLIFLVGLIEQFLYTLYLLSVTHYLILISSFLMFLFMILYLWLIDKIAKDKDSLKMIIIYALACSIGNYIAMILKIIK